MRLSGCSLPDTNSRVSTPVSDVCSVSVDVLADATHPEHPAVGTAVALSIMAISYWFVPYLTGRELWGRRLAVAQTWLWMAGVLFFLPAFILLSVLARIYLNFGDLTAVQGIFYAIKPAVVAVVLFAAWRIGWKSIKNGVLGGIAALAFVGWMIAGAGWHQSLVIAIAVLIITCPCAMGLAVPTAQVVAAGALLKRGLLVKDGSALERLAEVDIALFDKTGTLTLGEPRPDLGGLDAEAKRVALGLAQASRHPLSQGLAAALRAEGVKAAPIESLSEASGQGIAGMWNGQAVALTRPEHDNAQLATQLMIGEEVHLLTFHDPLRGDAAEALGVLRASGIEASIISGDRQGPVSAVAGILGIAATAAASPQDKLSTLEALRAAGHRPLMVGDGLNDGPALAAAHASIAPGTASDASQQAADAVFIGAKLMPVALAVKVARQTMAIVRQNFVLAIGYNALAVPLALFGYVTPLIAAIAMSMSSLIVVANSLRLAGSAK